MSATLECLSITVLGACGARIVWGAFGAKMVRREGGEDLVETAIFKGAYLKSGRSQQKFVNYKIVD